MGLLCGQFCFGLTRYHRDSMFFFGGGLLEGKIPRVGEGQSFGLNLGMTLGVLR